MEKENPKFEINLRERKNTGQAVAMGPLKCYNVTVAVMRMEPNWPLFAEF